MKTKLKKRLRSQAGETIAEVLIAMLISVLALTMLALMISSTSNLVNTSKTKMNEYYDENAALEMQTEGSESTAVISIQSENESTGTKVQVTVSDAKLFENDVFSKSVYAYAVAKSTG